MLVEMNQTKFIEFSEISFQFSLPLHYLRLRANLKDGLGGQLRQSLALIANPQVLMQIEELAIPPLDLPPLHTSPYHNSIKDGSTPLMTCLLIFITSLITCLSLLNGLIE